VHPVASCSSGTSELFFLQKKRIKKEYLLNNEKKRIKKEYLLNNEKKQRQIKT